MVKESDWQAEFIVWLKAEFCCEVLKIERASENAWPDLIVFMNFGRWQPVLLIECKALGKTLEPLQREKHVLLRGVCAVPPVCIDNLDDAKDYVLTMRGLEPLAPSNLMETLCPQKHTTH